MQKIHNQIQMPTKYDYIAYYCNINRLTSLKNVDDVVQNMCKRELGGTISPLRIF